MTNLPRAFVLGCLITCWANPAFAVDCGPDDCGPSGSCDPAGLLARCQCDDGYVSVATYIPKRNFGAYCVPIGALPSEELCQGNKCSPHGVCVVEGEKAKCVCDAGFQATNSLECVDDPADDAELACTDVACGKDSTCMAVTDALTCRCAAGGTVVQGQRSGENPTDKFGPACTFSLSREEACGPDLCGPYGSCIVGQAVICDCDDGYEEQDRKLNNRRHGYCVKVGTREAPNDPPPNELRINSLIDAGQASDLDGGLVPSSDAGDGSGTKGEKGKNSAQSSSGCQVMAMRGLGATPLGFVALVVAGWLTRRRRGRQVACQTRP